MTDIDVVLEYFPHCFHLHLALIEPCSNWRMGADLMVT